MKQAIGKCQFEHLYTPFKYQWPIASLVKDLKFSKKDYLAYQLSAFLLSYLKEVYQDTPLPEALIPVPMHVRRFMKRKYNQATLIANPLSATFGIPLSLIHI